MKLRYKKPLKFPVWSMVNGHSDKRGRYALARDGISAEFAQGADLPHANHIEMAGFKVSSIISYKINRDLSLKFYRFCVFPSLRINPNDTSGSLAYVFAGVTLKTKGIGAVKEKINGVYFDGILKFRSTLGRTDVSRRFIPARNKLALIEELTFSSAAEADIVLQCKKTGKTVKAAYTPDGRTYNLTTAVYANGKAFEPHNDVITVSGKKTVYIVYGAEKLTLEEVKEQIELREMFLAESKARLALETPDETLNRMIEFTKVRASESIFSTKNGLMHAPGGGNYYAALWTNDECEYANPLFAYLGYDKANEQSLNCYRLYSGLSKKDEAIYTSIIAEGDDYWHGAGDRGDSSMYVYGFARYLLTTGDRENTLKYLSALEDACTYVMSKMNADGVVASDSDELENRFESGKANLSTAVITYDAFLSMSIIERELGNDEKAAAYADFAEKVKASIKNYFEANVEGYETYRYCAEEEQLRSWICLPLTVGINDRLEGTQAALKSERLKKPGGLLTRSGSKTFWDRSLLYALRGLFYAGCADNALEMLKEYTDSRLFGEHVPYPVEAYPEGNAAHLSAESALYVRIFTEGMLGFRPMGFSSFELKPNLPSAWNEVTLKNFFFAGRALTIEMKKNGEKVSIAVPEIGFSAVTEMNSAVTLTL